MGTKERRLSYIQNWSRELRWKKHEWWM